MAVIAEEGMVRVTTSISPPQEVALKELAAKHKASVTWLVRYAVGQLVKRNPEMQFRLDFGTRR